LIHERREGTRKVAEFHERARKVAKNQEKILIVLSKSYLQGVVFLMVLLAGVGCGRASPVGEEKGEAAMALQVTSPVFTEGETIPRKFTCDAENVSPPLAWSGAPPGTQSFALIADDPDAPVGTWVHWVLYDLPGKTAALPEGVKGIGLEGVNDFRKPGYGGPCPPRGTPHRYYFKVYALDTQLGLKPGAGKRDVERAMQGHVLAQGVLIGKYGR
jgi:Raf kinase inhibitor-like YbhB/YbcL family protein